jgi:peptidyl-prolyl cis-trans isomerase A (cyclophilin A)
LRIAFVVAFAGVVHALGAQALPRVRIFTSLGEIEAEVDTIRAPISGVNFLRYVDGRYYDGASFFRTVRPDNQPADTVKIDVIQASAARGRGPGFPPIPLERTSVTGITHRDGSLSMARAGPDTARNSFSICIGDQPALDFGGHRNLDGQGFAAFGRVTRGMDVVRRIHTSAATEQRLTPPIVIDSIVRR